MVAAAPCAAVMYARRLVRRSHYVAKPPGSPGNDQPLYGTAKQRVTLCTDVLIAVAGPDAMQKVGHACTIDTFLTYNICICASACSSVPEMGFTRAILTRKGTIQNLPTIALPTVRSLDLNVLRSLSDLFRQLTQGVITNIVLVHFATSSDGQRWETPLSSTKCVCVTSVRHCALHERH